MIPTPFDSIVFQTDTHVVANDENWIVYGVEDGVTVAVKRTAVNQYDVTLRTKRTIVDSKSGLDTKTAVATAFGFIEHPALFEQRQLELES